MLTFAKVFWLVCQDRPNIINNLRIFHINCVRTLAKVSKAQLMYRDEELTLGSANHLVESGIMAVRRRMNRGQLKVFSSLTNYLEELRYYHCDEAGRVVTACDQLQNATRYLVVSGISKMSTAPLKDEFANWYGHTPRGWMAC
jgi:hypothetical protein